MPTRSALWRALALVLTLVLTPGAIHSGCGPEPATAQPASQPDASPRARTAAAAPAGKAEAKAKAKETAPIADDPVAPVPTRVPGAERVVAFGDVHGDIAATRAALRLAGALAPDGEHWAGGALVLVQTGDQLDRGDDERAILDLFERLQREARAAGGAFYVLNGNHELMNAAGDLRYVTPGGFADFARAPGVEKLASDPRFAEVPPLMRPRAAAFAPGGPYARVLARRPMVLVVGDTVFAHGGVLPQHARRGLEAINAEVQAWLLGKTGPTPPAIVASDDSPVWTRDYSHEPDAQDCSTLDEALRAIPAARMVVGHTVQPSGIASACDGKVWMIDVGMAAHYGGRPAALEIVGDQVRALE